MSSSSRSVVSCLAILTATCPAVVQAQAAPEIDAIVVTGQRAQQIRSLALKQEALGVMDAVSANDIGRLPDRNVAEVIERLPGVGVQYDQGEGRYASVRGVPSELNGYTLNGFEIGNPDGDTRALPLDVVSGQLLNRVEVSKVKSADQQAQGIGGTINLVTQTAFDFRDSFVVSANGQVGYQEMNSKSQPVQGDVSVGGRFGEDEQFGILVGASYSDRTFTSNGIYPDDWFAVDAMERGGLPTNLKYTDYRLNRERIGASGSFDWRPNDDHQFYVRGFYSKFKEDEYRQRMRLDFADADLVADGSVVIHPDGLTGTSTATQQRSDLRLEQKEKSVLAGMAGGQSRFGLWTAEYGIARIHNELDEPNQSWQFRGNPGPLDFDFTDKLYTVTPQNGYLTPADLEFREYTEQDDHGEEDTWAARLDLKRDLEFSENSFVKFGANFRTTDKSFNGNTTSYGRGSAGNRFSLDGLAGDSVWVDAGGASDYYLSPSIDQDAIIDFTEGKLGGPQFVLDESGTLADTVLPDYDLTEEVYAGYAMTNLEFGDVAVTAGLRVEHTKVDIQGFDLENEADVVAASGDADYTNWLPSLIVRYTPVESLIVRAAYSRSIGRPQYDSLRPGGEVGYVDNGDGTFDGAVSRGNPALKPYVSDNLDLTAEWYFAEGGILSAGAFMKFVKNPIFTQSFTMENASFGGRTYDRLEFSQPQNADEGEIKGVEFAYQQQFTFLPGLWSGFGFGANLTLVDSELKIPGRSKSGFPQQSDLLWGVQLFYEYGPVEASVGYHTTGKALASIGDERLTDVYNDDLRRLDAKFSYAFSPNFRMFVEGKNLTDEPTRQYQGGIGNWVVQNERYGRSFYVGAAVRF
ncbi:TonB-dependent receptor [Pedomonas mirosovicensis]|uniref:TonB-dependent receptor n=1 Tax=Pedomonas mirosovicensis TaxID=2908641 RepID=UPI00216A7420|nr:TonB-dependent receptor [Pedomonas mirosovicensis]MCH8686353.1 TonB-dependent receptor [Pedomonas mirosovicensis]